MNETAPRPPRTPTQAAEGLPRWRWTVAEFDRFIESGILTEDDRVELIGGELVPMAAKGIRHETVRADLQDVLLQGLDPNLRLCVELGWRPAADVYCEPDLLIVQRSSKPVSQTPVTEVLLLIEIADTSLAYDLSAKARTYAMLGVAEYWVIEAATLLTHVHRAPAQDGYGDIQVHAADATLRPIAACGVSLRLAGLGIDSE